MHIINNTKFKETLKINGNIFNCGLTNEVEVKFIYGKTDISFDGTGLSITNENMTYLLRNTTIEKGKIKENCILIKNGSIAIVLVEGTEEYIKVMDRKDTENIKLKVGSEYIVSGILREMVTGEINRMNKDDKDSSLIYMGSFLLAQSRYDSGYSVDLYSTYVFFSPNTQKYYRASSRDIFLLNELIENHDEYKNKENNVDLINDRQNYLYKKGDIDSLYRAFVGKANIDEARNRRIILLADVNDWKS